jgi:competence protein ComEA
LFYLSRAEQFVLFLLLAALLSGAGVLTYARGREAGLPREGAPILEEAPAQSASTLTVDVSGAVTAPGVYQMPAGARLGDAIALAGGPSAAADLNGVNMAARVQDGQKVSVPSRPPEGSPASTPAQRQSSRIISLNEATQADLESLPGIGEVYAKRIIDYREGKKRERGRGFESTDELLNVRGIGPRRLAALRPLVRP